MNSIQAIAALTAGSGLLIFALAIPLIGRRVPPNRLYGIRTKAAFASNSDWYRINSTGGRLLGVAGVIIFIAGVIGFWLPATLFRGYSLAVAAITLLAVLVPCVYLCTLKSSGSSKDSAGGDHHG